MGTVNDTPRVRLDQATRRLHFLLAGGAPHPVVAAALEEVWRARVEVGLVLEVGCG